jgi:hypothetical protein
MTASLEDTLISVWRQALVEDAKTVVLESGKLSCATNQPIQIA